MPAPPTITPDDSDLLPMVSAAKRRDRAARAALDPTAPVQDRARERDRFAAQITLAEFFPKRSGKRRQLRPNNFFSFEGMFNQTKDKTDEA